MLLHLIEDMNRALDHDCYFAALAIALMLPDICGKAKYPKARVGDRYIDWYDEYVGQYEKCPKNEGNPQDVEMPYLSGEVVYSLRCSFLHQGNPNIENAKIKDDTCKMDRFTLLIQKKNEFDLYSDSASVTRQGIDPKAMEETERCYEVNIRRLCLVLSLCASAYYKEYPGQFNFFNYDIVDLDERYANYDNAYTSGNRVTE